jgi:hydrogenase maturation protease
MHPGTILVIGYGNDLRGDDAAGQRAAHAVAAWGLPRVEVLAVHQLSPELADPLAAAERAVFLDAHSASSAPTARVRRISPATPPAGGGHASDPRTLLALAERAFGRAPEAWWITMPASDFSFGAALSPVAECGIAEALKAIRPLLGLRTSPDAETGISARGAHPERPRGRR